MSATIPRAAHDRSVQSALTIAVLVAIGVGVVAYLALHGGEVVSAITGFSFYRPPQLLFGQLLLGLINGAFYALLSLGLAVIFGMLNIINFAHGALFMLGAFVAWMLLTPNTWLGMISPGLAVPDWLNLGYWPALILAPIIVGAFGLLMEKTIISRLYKLDHLYGLLLTFGVALILEGLARNAFGSSGMPYRIPAALQGGTNLGFMFMPNYRGWVLLAAAVMCLITWVLIEKTQLGARLRAATENPGLVQAFGVNVPRMISLTYAGGVALAAFAGRVGGTDLFGEPQYGQQFHHHRVRRRGHRRHG